MKEIGEHLPNPKSKLHECKWKSDCPALTYGRPLMDAPKWGTNLYTVGLQILANLCTFLYMPLTKTTSQPNFGRTMTWSCQMATLPSKNVRILLMLMIENICQLNRMMQGRCQVRHTLTHCLNCEQISPTTHVAQRTKQPHFLNEHYCGRSHFRYKHCKEFP